MNSTQILRRLSAAIITSLAISPSANATDYFVDQTSALASDENPGTMDLPFLTISHATTLAQAGDTVTVNAGTYTETVTFANSGAPGLPIALTANGTVVIQPPAVTSWSGGINIVGRSDVTVSGFTVQSAFFGIKVDKNSLGVPSQRIVIKNNRTVMTESSGIRVAFSKDVTVDSNTVEKANYGGVHEMISIIGTDGFDVKNNEVFNGAFIVNNVAMEGKEGIDAKTGSSNGRISNNKVHDLVRLGIYVDAWDKLSGNIEVSGNIVFTCKQGIALSSEAGGTLQNVTVYNNITYNNAQFGIIVSAWAADGPRENINISNNTAHGNLKGGISVATTNASLVTLQNNIASNNSGPQLYAVSTGIITTSSNNLVNGKNLGNVSYGTISGDPRFVSATTGDFRLGNGSAAANKGVTLKAIPQDIVGTWRPLGRAYDIGAFESN